MKIRRHYLTLRRYFSAAPDHAPIEATTQELAAVLDCTQRNIVLLLKRMQQEEWLKWIPKRGRGNRSSLIFLVSETAIILQEAQAMALKQDLQAALELLQQHEDSPRLMGQFQDWLSEQFGFHTELEDRRRTDVLRFPLPQTIHSLDPAATHYFGESHLVNQLFDGLVRMDTRGEVILPHLAHAWETDTARTRWTFYLRKGVQFHHGREMSSADVVYSLKRLQELSPQGLYSWAYSSIQSMETPDDTTIHIQLKERNEAFLSFLTTNRASIVPRDVCEAEGRQFGRRPIGSGPFRLAAGSEQGIWILEAFAPYFQGRAFLDRVEVWTMPNSHMDKAADELNHFQVMHNVRISEIAGEQWQQVRQSGTTCKFITVNGLKNGPLAHPAVRHALNRAINRTMLLSLLSGDVIEGAASFWLRSEQANKMMADEQPDAIQQALAEAGYRGEKLIMATIPQYESDAAIVQQVCARSGIPLEIRLIDAEQFKGTDRMTADLLLFAVMLDEHRELRLIDLYKSMQQHMQPEQRDALEQALRRILIEPIADKRAKLFIQIEQQLTERHSLLFLYRKHLKTAFHPSVRGISLESLGWVRFRDLWFT